MAKRLLRLHLSAGSRDFEPIALEPGLPLLDKSGAADRILRKWLGRLAAQPEWDADGHKDSVSLYLCDDEGRRLNEASGEPATSDELRRNPELKRDFDDIARRLAEVQPETNTEKKVADAVTKSWAKLAESSPAHQECHFFKYRAGKSWRLAWCWGFRRKDLEPAKPTVCTNPTCELLFVKRSEGSRKCPACESEQLAKKAQAPVKRKSGGKLWLAVAAALLVLAVGGGVGIYFATLPKGLLVGPGPKNGDPPKIAFQVTPDKWNGPVGGKVEFTLKRQGDRGEEDVTRQVVAVVEHPQVARIVKGSLSAVARAPGTTVVHFYLGSEETRATLTIEAGKSPTKLTLQPAEVTLGLGTTAQLKLVGHYEDGSQVDLTEAAQWQPTEGATIYGHHGLVEGLAAGKATVRAKYRAAGAKTDLEAAAAIEVKEEQYESLKLALDPPKLAPGQVGKLTAQLATKSGETRSAVGSSQLKIEIDPNQLAKLNGDQLEALYEGQGKLVAAYKGLTSEAPFQIEGTASQLPFDVTPKELALIVGEITDLSIPPGDGEVLMESSSPNVEVLANQRIVGRKPGTAVLAVKRGDQTAEVAVEVKEAKLTGIAIVPERVDVPVDDTTPLRVVGKYAAADGAEQEAELAPDQVSAEQIPVASFVDFDPTSLKLRGVAPTGGTPQLLALRVGDHSAATAIHVVAPPLSVELTPAEPQQLPVGQSIQLQAWANYGNRRVELLPDRVEWKVKPEKVAGLEFDSQSSVVRAIEAGKRPLSVSVVYQGNASNAVEITSVAATPVVILLTSQRQLLVVGETGQISVQGGLEGVTYATSDGNVLALDSASGIFRAETPGEVTVTASHAAAAEKAELKFKVVAADEVQLVLRPDNVKLGVGNRAELKLFATAAGVEEEISMVGDGSEVQITIARPDAVGWEAPALVGLAAAVPLDVTAVYRGKTAKATVEVVASTDEKGVVPELRVVPSEATLAAGQPLSPRVEQKLPGEGDNWAEVEPQRVKWTVPSEIVWTPADADLRPRLLVGPAAKGPLALEAEFGGKKAPLTIHVGPPPTPDPNTPLVVVREPEGETIAVGQRQRYTIMMTSGGKLVPAAGVKWLPAFENEFVSWQPAVLTGLRPGHVQPLKAKVGSEVVTFETRIEGPTAPAGGPAVDPGVTPLTSTDLTGELVVAPRVIRLRVGESKQLGSDVSVVRSGVDVSRQVEVVSADSGIARYDADSGSLVGVAPGRVRVALTHGDAGALLGVIVEPFTETAEKGSVVIEPASGALAVGERRGVRVYLVTGSGQRIDRTSSAVLESSSESVLAVRGSHVVGIAPGTAEISAQLPGAPEPGRASFTVGEQTFSRLIVTPAQMRLGVGEERQFRVFAVGPEGRHELSDHPKLKATVGGPNGEAIELRGLGNVRGLSNGRASVEVSWDDKLSDKLLVAVSDDPITRLRIEPSLMTIGVDERQSYLVFARRGNEEHALSAENGVELRVADSSVAALAGPLTVKGMRTGATQVVALLGRQRASARLNVASSASGGSGSSTAGSAPPPRTVGLRFSPDRLRLAAGAPGAGVRVLRVYNDGQEEDVSHLATLAVGEQGVAEARPSTSGPTVHPLKVGRTQVTANVGELRTAHPLLVDVFAYDPSRASLECHANPLSLVVGEVGGLSSVRLRPDGASTPLDVDYRLESLDPSIAAVENGRQLRGLAPGTARVRVRPVGVDERLQALTGSITVRVSAANSAAPAEGTAQLVLSGASRTTVGAETAYRVELLSGGLSHEVTHEAATLVLDRDQVALADVLPGCMLVARRAGTATVRAQYRDLISNPVVVRIDPLAERFARLEIDIDRRPLSVGESRGYTLWGVPAGGGPRQDLTSGITTDRSDLTRPRVVMVGEAATHTPPHLLATAPGHITLGAALADLRSERIELDVLGGAPADDLLLSAEPAVVTIRVGERTPRLTVFGRRPGERSGRPLEAKWESLDDAIASTSESGSSQFVGKGVGATQVKATIGSQIVAVDVNVIGSRFTSVQRDPEPRFYENETFFDIGINVEAVDPSGQLEYRVVGADEAGATAWTPAAASGGTVKAALTSPKLRKGPFTTVYHLTIEARDKKSGSIERYPCSFRLKPTTD